MEDFEFKSIIKISDRPELISRAAAWFSDKWSVPQSAYEKSMREAVSARGGAIFFSTHVLEVAEKLCDKVAIIKDGRLIKSGTMEQVRGDTSLEDVFLELEDDNA